MTVGEYAGVPLQNPDDTWRNGAVFALRDDAVEDAAVELDGWTTTVIGGKRAVITCGPSTATTQADSFAVSLVAANLGLDFMSAIGQSHSAIVDAEDANFVWWHEPVSGDVVMRATQVATFPMSSNPTFVVTDATGNVVPPSPPATPMAHDAFRFIRMCKTSDDLFDAYRNLFLAFECLLSAIRPRQRTSRNRWEGEKQWFMAALAVADEMVPVVRLAPQGEPNPKDCVYQNIYSAERSALMHAKQGQHYLLPHDATSRAQLTRSLGSLWGYVQELMKKHLGVKSGFASFYKHGWAMMADNMLKDVVLFASDDATPHHRTSENPVLSDAAHTVEMEAGPPSDDPSDALLRTTLGSCVPAELGRLDGIRRAGARLKGDTPYLVIDTDLTGPLHVGDSLTRFEVLYGARSVSAMGAPRHFSS